MKKTKILAVCLVVFAMLISFFNVNSLAITTNDKGKITVSGVEAGVKVTIYRLVDVNYDFFNDQLNDPAYGWRSEIATWVENNYSSYEDFEVFSKISDADAEKFYDDLAAAIRQGTLIADSESKNADVDGTATFTDLEKMGSYLVLIENGKYVYRPSVVNVTPKFENERWQIQEGVVNVKRSEAGITKTINGKTDSDNVNTSDNIAFVLSADVPKYLPSSLLKDYYISDIFENGELVGNVRVVATNGSDPEKELVPNTDYTISYESPIADASGNKTETLFTLKINYESISTYNTVKVTYDAKLTNNATIGKTDGNDNTAYLYYTRNPYETGSALVEKNDTVTAYTYQTTIIKLDNIDRTKKLAGAEFTLSDKDGREITFEKKSDGVYYKSNKVGSIATVVVGKETENLGKLELKGLVPGEYSLLETKAPNDYTKDPIAKTITVSEDATIEINFFNKKSFQLPMTGGVGTIVFTASGVLLIGLGIALLVIINRKKQNKR